jgi:hypothetical protein
MGAPSLGRRFADIACKTANAEIGERVGGLSAAELESRVVTVGNPRYRQFASPT